VPNIRGWIDLVRQVWVQVRDREVTFLAASIAYYAFVSILPLLILALVVASLVGGPDLQATVASLADQFLLPVGEQLVGDALGNTDGRSGMTVAGVLLLTWSALKLFRGMSVAFARIYGTESVGLVEQLTEGLVTLVGVGVGTLAILLLIGLLGFVPSPVVAVVAPFALVVLLVVAFLPLYYVYPTPDLSVREALPGAVFAAVGWTVFGTIFGWYARYAMTSGRFAVYGVLGAILLLVTWFYVAGLVVLVGAVVNAVVAGRVGSGPAATTRPGPSIRHD
jgi:YihY family inner membrane protein